MTGDDLGAKADFGNISCLSSDDYARLFDGMVKGQLAWLLAQTLLDQALPALGARQPHRAQ